MNVYDSRRMEETLAPLGFTPSERVEDSELVILNTCHIREKATEKVFSELGRLNRIKQARAATGERMVIAVAGCVAQAEGEEIVARAPYVDLVFGPQTYHQLPEMVGRAARASGAIINTDFPAEPKFDSLPGADTPSGPAAFVTVQEGCDKFCSFCVVPYTRGAEYSRPAAAILAEIADLVARGAREITLLGQNVNAWHGEGTDGRSWGLGRLLFAIAEMPAAPQRLRYTTSHPRDVDAALIAAHGELSILMPFLHLPVQSGSDRILAAMNRKHSAEDYLRLVDRLRTARPDLALSSDFIVGHPGETDQDFAATLKLVREVGYASAYSFKYSRRPGTPASGIAEQVPEADKAERLESLQSLLNAQQEAFNHGHQGQSMDVLFDRQGQRPGQLLGRSPWNQSVHASAPARLLGQIVPVAITAAHANSLSGTVISAVAETQVA